MEPIVDEVRRTVLDFVEDQLIAIRSNTFVLEVTIPRLESCISAISVISELYNVPWSEPLINTLETLVDLLTSLVERPDRQRTAAVGRPKLEIPLSTIEFLLSLGFKVTQIGKVLGVSVSTVFRRLRGNGTSARGSYSNIDQDELNRTVLQILNNHPNTGYKRMKGFLLHRGIKLTDIRVREIMRYVDPVGVYQRTIERNQVIRRRKYHVKYSNQLWHIDGNLKLIRWGIVIRGAIDGKSRTVTYLSAGNNNRADTHLASFLEAVRKYGTPLHTRSDKGGENVLIAKYMIETRGVGRSSHICGRSVHNQRIERHWRDVRTGCTWVYRQVFEQLEDEGYLDVDNELHVRLLHRVFIPRINSSLQGFTNGWNSHPISTEHNRTPAQLMLLHLPPAWTDLVVPDDMDESDVFMNNYQDLSHFQEESFTNPSTDELSSTDIILPSSIDLDKPSACFGYDVFREALPYLR